MTLEGGTLIDPSPGGVGRVPDARVVIRDGVVVYAGPRRGAPEDEGAAAPTVDAGGGWIIPGLVDVHVHGGGGADTMDGSVEGLRAMTQAHARAGTTAILCTTVTASQEQLLDAERAVVEAARRQRERWGEDGWGARIAGIHLEGPYLNPERKGAQNPAHMRNPSVAEMEALQEASLLPGEGPLWRLMTIAPERPGGVDAIRWMALRGVAASIGHSTAEGETLEAAIAAGARQVTHLFNGMSPFGHRAPGLVGAALSDERITAQLIADGVHVHPVALKVARRARGARGIALITDALAPMGLGEGRFRLGDFEVVVKDGACRLLDGTLAGSILGLGEAVAHMIRWAGASLEEAVAMASSTPAASVGLAAVAGTLRPGAWGDAAVLAPQTLAVRHTVVAGRLVYQTA